jgi:hypothetical protein
MTKEEMEKQAAEQRQLSAEIIEHILDAPDGHIKEASQSGTRILRRRVREDGVFRRILTPKTATDSMLTRLPDHDNPVIVRDMEPDSKGAMTVPFGAGLDSEFYSSNAYVCKFETITTPEFTKDVNQLRVLSYDLPKLIQDNSIKDIQKTEDFSALAVVDTIVGSIGGNGAAGYVQNHQIIGDINKQTYPEVLNALEDNEIENGVVLMNRRTAKKFLTNWDADDFGDALAGETFRKGMSAIDSRALGIPHIFTIKRGLVPDNVVYVFASEEFLGNFDILEDVKLFVKKEKDIITFSSREVISVTFGNVGGMHRFEFVGA